MALLDRFIRKEIEPQADLVSDLRAVSNSKKNSAFAVEYTIARVLGDEDKAANAEAEAAGEPNPVKKYQRIVIVFNNKAEVVLAYDIHDHLDIGYRMLWGTDSEYAEFVDDAAKMSKGVDTNRHYVFSNHFSQNVRFVEYIDVIYTDYVLQKLSELHDAYENERVEERVVEDLSKSDANKIGFFNASLDTVEEHIRSIASRKEKALNKIGLSEAESDNLFVEDAFGLDDREDINKLLLAASEADSDTSLLDIRRRSNGFLWVDVLDRIASSNGRGWLKLVDPETGHPIEAHDQAHSEVPEREEGNRLTSQSRYDEFSLGEDELELGVGAEVVPGDYSPEESTDEAQGEETAGDNVDNIFDDITEGRGFDEQPEEEAVESEDSEEDYDGYEDFFTDTDEDTSSSFDEETEEPLDDGEEVQGEDVVDAELNEASSYAWEDEEYSDDIFTDDEDEDDAEEVAYDAESVQDQDQDQEHSEDYYHETTPEDSVEPFEGEDTVTDEPDAYSESQPEIEADVVEEEEVEPELEAEIEPEPEPEQEKSFYVPLDNEFPSFFVSTETEDDEEVESVEEGDNSHDEEEDGAYGSVIVGSSDGESEDELYLERIRNGDDVEETEATANWPEDEENGDYEVSSEYSEHVEQLDEESDSNQNQGSEYTDDTVYAEDVSSVVSPDSEEEDDDVLYEDVDADESFIFEDESEASEEDDDEETASDENTSSGDEEETLDIDVFTTPHSAEDEEVVDEDTEDDYEDVYDTVGDDGAIDDGIVDTEDDTEEEEYGTAHEEEYEVIEDYDIENLDETIEDIDSNVEDDDVAAFADQGQEQAQEKGQDDREPGHEEYDDDFYSVFEDFGVEKEDSERFERNEHTSLPTLHAEDIDTQKESSDEGENDDDFEDYPAIDHIDADEFMREYRRVASEEDSESDDEHSVPEKTESGVTHDAIFSSLGLDNHEFSKIFENLIRDKQRADEKLAAIPVEIAQHQKDLEDLQHQANRDSEEISRLNDRFETLKQQQQEIQEELELLFPELDEKSAYAVRNQYKIKQKSVVLERLETEQAYYTSAQSTAEKLLEKVKRSDPTTAHSVTAVLEKIRLEEEAEDEEVTEQNTEGGEEEMSEKTENKNETDTEQKSRELDPDQLATLEHEGGGVIEAVRVEDRLKFRGEFVDGVDEAEEAVETVTADDSEADSVEDEEDDISRREE